MKSPIVAPDHHRHHIVVITRATWHDAMDGKVMITQTSVSAIQWDFDQTVMVDGMTTFLCIMNNEQRQRCNLMNCDKPYSFECWFVIEIGTVSQAVDCL